MHFPINAWEAVSALESSCNAPISAAIIFLFFKAFISEIKYTGVLSISSGNSSAVGTTTIYLKNDGIYYIGKGTDSNYHGFADSTGGSQPVPRTVNGFTASGIKKFMEVITNISFSLLSSSWHNIS